MAKNEAASSKNKAKTAKGGRVRRAALAACSLAAALAVLTLAAALNPKWLASAVNAGLAMAGLNARVSEAVVGIAPPRVDLAGVSVSVRMPEGPVMSLSARAQRVSITRRGEVGNGWPGGWLVEAVRPEVDVAVREIPGGTAGTHGQERGAAAPYPNLAVKVTDARAAVSWPDGRATAEMLNASIDPGGSFSASALVIAEAGRATAGTGADRSPPLTAESGKTAMPEGDIPPDASTSGGPASDGPGVSLSGRAFVSFAGQADLLGQTVRAVFRVESGELGAGGASLPVEAQGEVTAGPGSVTLDRLAVNLGPASIGPGASALPPWAGELAGAHGLTASLRGQYKDGAATLEMGSVHVPGFLLARADMARDPEGNVTVQAEGAVEDVARLKALWGAGLPEEAKDLVLAGQIPFSASVAYPAQGPPTLRAAVAAPSVLAHSKALGVSAAASLEAAFDDGTLSGRLAVRGEVRTQNLQLPGVTFETRLAGRAPAVLFEGVRFSCAPGRLPGGVAFPGLSGTGGAGFTADQSGLSGGAAFEAEIADVGTVGFRLKLSPGAPPVVESARAALRLDRLAGLAGLGGRTEKSAAGKAKTAAAGKASAGAKPGAPGGLAEANMSGSVEISLTQGGFSPGRPIGAQARLKDVRLDLPGLPGLASRLAGRAETSFDPAAPGTLHLSLALTGGTLRLPTAELNLAALPLKLAATAARAGDGVSLDASASLSGLAGAALKGRFLPGAKGWTGQGEAKLTLGDLAGCLKAFAPAVAKESGVTVGGKARMAVAFSGPLGSPSLTGRGEAEVEELRAGPLSASRLRVPVILGRDLLRFHDEASPSLEFTVLGGRLALHAPEVRKPFSQDPEARLSAQLSGVALGPLTGKKVESEASARFESITLTREMLSLEGEVTAKAFGGDLIVKGIKVARPFAKDRQVRLHAGLLGADMLSLSALTGVGRITGRLNVTLSELHMAGFLPLAFTLRIESVSAPGVTQRISLGAVNSLTEVSAGRPVDLGLAARAALKLFGDFGYTKLGLMIGLKGSMCTIRGLHREGGVEYILKRSGLTGVDVTNANPENAMPFADLLVRIKKIMNKESSPQVRMGLGHSHEAPRQGPGTGHDGKRPAGGPSRPEKPEHNEHGGTP